MRDHPNTSNNANDDERNQYHSYHREPRFLLIRYRLTGSGLSIR